MKKMKKNIGMFSLCVLPLACSYVDDVDNDVKAGNPDQPQSETEVINGIPAEYTDFPSIVALADAYGGEMCTGTMIKEDLVLTAAHCIPYIESAVYGESEIADAASREFRR